MDPHQIFTGRYLIPNSLSPYAIGSDLYTPKSYVAPHGEVMLDRDMAYGENPLTRTSNRKKLFSHRKFGYGQPLQLVENAGGFRRVENGTGR
jgi:hypothetical protein